MKSNARVFAAGLLLALPNFALTSALAGQETEASEPAREPVWAFEDSDVEVDPGYTFGQLDNGMRYIVRQNGTPEGTAVVRMRIDSGSLDETESERGLSHFLEHMAFNGSKGIPEGEMIKLLEREGLAFGADTNATTGLNAITYILNLPRNDEDLLDTALMLMRETASELTIAPDAVDRERGVVLSERRDRAGFAQRNREDSYEFSSPGARFIDRLPIGTIERLETATAEQMRGLYERTYTPSNTVLVIVGDYPVEVMEAAIRAKFSDWKAAPAPEEPEAGPIDITRKGLTDIYLDPALSESVQISRLGPWSDEPDTLANRKKQFVRGIGYAIINRRLARLAREADAPYRGASYGTGSIFEDALSTGIGISSVDGEWRKGMLAAVQIVNEALTYGFTAAEVDEQLKRSRTAAENAVSGYNTFSNGYFMGQALGLVANERVPATPAYTLEQFEAFAPSVTAEAVHKAVMEHAVPLDDPLIRFTGRTAPEGAEEGLRSAFAEGMALPIDAPKDTGIVEFAYSEFGEPGSVVSDETNEELGIRKLVFANGVRLNLKKTDIREDRIRVSVRVDGGNLMRTKEDPLRVYLADSLMSGGLGAHSIDELQTVLAGRSVSTGFGSSADGFSLGSTTTARDLDLQMKVFAAILTDPGYRSEGVERFRKGIDNFFETLYSTPGRAYSTAIGAQLSDGDPRFSLQPKEAYLALDYDKLKSAIADRLENGAIEVAMVGDLDEDTAIASVASTLAALPAREPDFVPRDEARKRTFTANRGLTKLEHEGEADQALLRMIWPTTDDEDFAEALRLSMLGRVVRLELTDRLREELGQTYSPSAGSSTSRIYDDYGTFSISASVDVKEIEATRAAVRGLIADLREAPVDQDLIERARKPILESYANALKNLGGWMGLTARAQSEPERLERWFAAPDLLKAITPDDIQAEAIQYLDPDAAIEVHVLPGENARADADTVQAG
ncbi:M16 family metallopeptidase [Erythrobacter sp. F6033]|uniref:M16 family metallopeptidase n=1 Tax=Erythrobacter sp. F6033 TaxID=2926401 RepID=UPI001FF26DBD|nr:M16 family metallopeptidase [Erythrobacter sp. F6033]MCK0128876.1 insulinase family protein [Erythrobacter sp. F6033]